MTSGLFGVDRFNEQMRDFARRLVPEQLVLLQKRTALAVLVGVVEKTPVDTGRARGNWQVDIGTPRYTTRSATGKSTEPDSSRRRQREASSSHKSLEAGERKIASVKNGEPFVDIHISNTLPYIEFLENGSSSQAPVGMLAVTLNEVAAETAADLGFDQVIP